MNTIYLLRNKCNDKIYVGQTWRSLKNRWIYGHGYRGCLKIHRAIEAHGKDNFYYEIMTFCATQEAADYWETYFINKYDSVNSGYNVCPVGARGSMTGRKHSERSRLKMSESKKAAFIGNANPFYGKHHSEETRQALSAYSKKWYDENNHPFLGKKHTEAHTRAQSEGQMGQHRSIATEFQPGKIWVPNSATKLNMEIAENVRTDHFSGMSGIALARKYGLSRASVSRIINHKQW